MKHILLAAFLALLSSPLPLQARLGDTPRECGLRYHGMIQDNSNTTRPLIPDVLHATFVYKGWHIRFAFLDNRAAAAEYRKELSHPDGAAITRAELESILEAEKGDSSWKAFKGDLTLSPGKMVQQVLINATSKRWQRADGATAETVSGLSCVLKTPQAEQAIAAHAERAAEAQKARIPKF